MSASLKGTNQYLPEGSQHDPVRYYGWRTGRGIKIALITTDQAVKLGTIVSEKYEWNQVSACFKTKFILGICENLVIIMTDGKYVVVKGSVSELVEVDGTFSTFIAESYAGGKSFDEIYRKFSAVANHKNINRTPQICLEETPYITLIVLVLSVMAIGLLGPTMVTVSVTLLLLALFLYELYCVRSLKSLARKLSIGGSSEGTTANKKDAPDLKTVR